VCSQFAPQLPINYTNFATALGKKRRFGAAASLPSPRETERRFSPPLGNRPAAPDEPPPPDPHLQSSIRALGAAEGSPTSRMALCAQEEARRPAKAPGPAAAGWTCLLAPAFLYLRPVELRCCCVAAVLLLQILALRLAATLNAALLLLQILLLQVQR